ncbi:MAG: 30S ribosomal protein S18 [Candidatus Margulisbacteria bacterium]|jgi:small subunit ribosomal protein S18|nr:30S ribosomal protein S18 [Candidatus Margulisiibacteriota bacterium]
MSKDTKNKKSEHKLPLPMKKRRGKPCYFCENHLEELDYKDLALVQRFQSPRGKILPRRQSNCCAKHQRKVAQAIKRARYMALLPYVVEQ